MSRCEVGSKSLNGEHCKGEARHWIELYRPHHELHVCDSHAREFGFDDVVDEANELEAAQ